MGQVFLAEEADVHVALRMDSYLKEGANTGNPGGVYRAGGTDAVIYLDADFLLGPEAAHLNIRVCRAGDENERSRVAARVAVQTFSGG